MNKKIIVSNKILVGENLELKDNIAIVIKDDKIEELVDKDKILDYENYEVIDYGDMVVMPGLIDCHNHLALDARLENHLIKMTDPEFNHIMRALKTMKDDLYSGITSSRYMGDKYYIDVKFRNEQNSGNILGPRIYCCGIGMRSLHGHGYVGEAFVGVDEFRRQSRMNISKGVDFLKIFATGVIRDKDFIPNFLTDAEIRCVVEEAKSVGIPTAVHVSGGRALDQCIDNGVDVFEHVYYIDEEQIDKINDSNRWVTFTPSYAMDDELLFKFSKNTKERTLYEKDLIMKSLSKAIEKGINFGIGTDGLHTNIATEAKYISELGASNLDIVKGITSNAAKIMRKENVGSIDKNKLADLVVLKENPLENINALQNIEHVVFGGQLIRWYKFVE